MPQKTNLNIGPYYDDFNKDKNFYKVLFRPGYPVQARELTTLQSSLHNQLESFGSHMFKEGSMVIPGNISYNNEYYSLRLLDNHLGIPISLYISHLKGKRLKGQNSGVVVSVDDYKLVSDASDITDITLFISYVASGDDNKGGALEDGEQLITEESFVYGNTAVNAGDTVATLVSLDAAATGSSEKSKTVWPFKNSESFAFALPSSAIFDNLFLATLTPQLDSLIKFLNSEISETVSPL